MLARPDSSLLIRPSLVAYARRRGAILTPLVGLPIFAAILGISALDLVQEGWPPRPGPLLAVLTLTPVFGALAFFSLAGRVLVQGERMLHVSLGGMRSVPIQEITAVERIRVAGSRRRPRLLVFRSDSNCRVVLYADYWRDADLDRLIARIGLEPVGTWGGSQHLTELTARLTGLPGGLLHPGRVLWLVFGLLVVVVTVASLFGSRP